MVAPTLVLMIRTLSARASKRRLHCLCVRRCSCRRDPNTSACRTEQLFMLCMAVSYCAQLEHPDSAAQHGQQAT